jgi:hypothetical protein
MVDRLVKEAFLVEVQTIAGLITTAPPGAPSFFSQNRFDDCMMIV